MNLKRKNIILLGSTLVLLWVSYQFSFSKTLDTRQHYLLAKQESELFNTISDKFTNLKRQDQYYDSILKAKKIATDRSFQNNLLSTINTFTDSTTIAIVSFQNPHVFIKDDAKIFTYNFAITGDFNNTIRLLYKLEQLNKLGKIISVHFEKKKNYRRNFEYLECSILLQHLEN